MRPLLSSLPSMHVHNCLFGSACVCTTVQRGFGVLACDLLAGLDWCDVWVTSKNVWDKSVTGRHSHAAEWRDPFCSILAAWKATRLAHSALNGWQVGDASK
jgi:hypothetical protein